MSDYGFDEEIDRSEVPALKVRTKLGGTGADSMFAAGVADMDFRAPPAVLRALSRRAAHGIFGYESVPEGLMPALTGWLQARHGWSVDPTHLLRAPNVLNSLAMAVNLFTEVGDGVIVQPPVFFDFADIIAENGRRLMANPLVLKDGRYEMDFDGLEQAAAAKGTRMLLLCNPHNPVGRVWSKSELETLGSICRNHGVLTVSDEIHGDLTFPGHPYVPFASVSQADALNSVTCLSPAKSFNLAACCSAFTLVPDDARRETFQAENSRLTVNKNNAFANVAMEAAYRNGGQWLDAAMAYIGGNLDLVRHRLSDIPRIDLIEPEGTFLLWIDFRKLQLAPEDLDRFLRQEARWVITQGASFGTGGDGFGRLNIACPRKRLESALNRLGTAVSIYLQ